MDVVSFLTTSTLYASNAVFFLYCLAVSHRMRKSNSWTKEEAMRNPVGSLVSILIVNFGGLILINGFVKGSGIVSFFKDDIRVFICVFAWYLIYYVDVVYNVLSLRVVKVALGLLLTWKRSRDIIGGIFDAKVLFKSFSVSMLIGVLSGWGGTLLFPYEAQLRFRTVHNDLHQPSFSFYVVVVTCFVYSAFSPAFGYTGSSFVGSYVQLLVEHVYPSGINASVVQQILGQLTISKYSGELFIIIVSLLGGIISEFGLVESFRKSVGGKTLVSEHEKAASASQERKSSISKKNK